MSTVAVNATGLPSSLQKTCINPPVWRALGKIYFFICWTSCLLSNMRHVGNDVTERSSLCRSVTVSSYQIAECVRKKHKQMWENEELCTEHYGVSFSWRSISVVWMWGDGPFTTRCSSLVVGEVLSIQTLPFNTTRTVSVLFTFLAAKQCYVPITHKHSQKHDLLPFPEMDLYNYCAA